MMYAHACTNHRRSMIRRSPDYMYKQSQRRTGAYESSVTGSSRSSKYEIIYSNSILAVAVEFNDNLYCSCRCSITHPL